MLKLKKISNILILLKKLEIIINFLLQVQKINIKIEQEKIIV